MEKVFYGDKLNTVRGAQPQVLITSQPTNTPPECTAFRKKAHRTPQEWEEAMKADTLNIFDNGETRTPILVVNAVGSDGGGYNIYADENKLADDTEQLKSYTLRVRQGCAGGGKGALIQTDKSGYLGTSNDQVLFQPITPRERERERVVALDRASYNQGKNAKFGIGISEDGVAWSLTAKGPGAVCHRK